MGGRESPPSEVHPGRAACWRSEAFCHALLSPTGNSWGGLRRRGSLAHPPPDVRLAPAVSRPCWSLWIHGPMASVSLKTLGGKPQPVSVPQRALTGDRQPPPRPAMRQAVRRPSKGPGPVLPRKPAEGLQTRQSDVPPAPLARNVSGLREQRLTGRKAPSGFRSSNLRVLRAAAHLRGGCSPLRPPRGRCGVKVVTWLILPVVICLSQRLSHACLSISKIYSETANGSLNQLSFI
jgi:hypothetical protein